MVTITYTCPACQHSAEPRQDNRGNWRCTACWAIVPTRLLLPETTEQPDPVVIETKPDVPAPVPAPVGAAPKPKKGKAK